MSGLIIFVHGETSKAIQEAATLTQAFNCIRDRNLSHQGTNTDFYALFAQLLRLGQNFSGRNRAPLTPCRPRHMPLGNPVP